MLLTEYICMSQEFGENPRTFAKCSDAVGMGAQEVEEGWSGGIGWLG